MEQSYEWTLSTIRKTVLEQTDIHSLYIPLQGKHTTNPEEEPFDLAEKIRSFFVFDEISRSDPKVMLLMGDTGSGKSMFSQQLHEQLWREYKTGDPIPLWIPLPELENPFEGAVEEVLKKYECNESQIAEMKATEKFIFVVDGYDELHQFQNCYVTNKWSTWNAKVLITCRSQALYYQKDPDKYFVPFSGEKRLTWLLRKLYVAAFSQDQINAYIEAYNQEDHQIDLEDFDKIPGLKELITTPFLLHLSVESLPDILANILVEEENPQMTQAKLYDVFIERWFTRQVKKLALAGQLKESEQKTKQQFWDYCQRLAQKMHAKDVSVIHYRQQKAGGRLFGNHEKRSIWEAFFNEETEVLRSACPLKRMGDYHYGFIHASFVEYFAMRAMYEEIQEQGETEKPLDEEKEEMRQASGSTEKKPSGGIHYRVFAKEPNGIRNLADRILMNEGFKRKMLRIVERSKIKEEYAVGAANAFTALVRARVTFNGADLSGIKISEADISGGYFDRTNFEGADLRQVHLSHTWLRQAIFQGCQLDGIDFGEYPWFMHSFSVDSIVYRPDSNLLVTASLSEVLFWNIESGECYKKLIGHTGRIWSVSLSEDCKIAASGGDDKTVRIWDTASAQVLKVLRGHETNVISVHLSADGNTVASCGYENVVRVWNMVSGEAIVLEGHTNHVTCIHVSSDGKTVASGSWDNTVRIWDVDSRQVKAVLQCMERVRSVYLSLDCKSVVSGTGNVAKVWDIESCRFILLNGKQSICHDSVYLSSDGKTMVSSGGIDNMVHVWDVASGQSRELSGHENRVRCAQLSLDGKTIASGSWDNTVRIWDITTAQQIQNQEGHQKSVTSVHLGRDGKILVSGSEDCTVRTWDVEKGKEIMKFQGDSNEIRCVFLSLDGKYIVSGCGIQVAGRDYPVRVWNMANGEAKVLRGHTSGVTCVQISSDNKIVISSGMDRTVRVWDVDSDKVTVINNKYTVDCISLSADGKSAALGCKTGAVRVWNLATGDMKVLRGHKNNVNSVFLSADGKTVVSGSGSGNSATDNTVRVWDVKSGKAIIFSGHERSVTSVYMSSDCRTVFSADGNISLNLVGYSLRIWDLTSKSQIAMINLKSEVNGISIHDASGLLALALKNGSIQVWQRMDDQGQEWIMKWSSMYPNSSLQLSDCNIRGSTGLSSANRRLLEQRGGITETTPTPITMQKTNPVFQEQDAANSIEEDSDTRTVVAASADNIGETSHEDQNSKGLSEANSELEHTEVDPETPCGQNPRLNSNTLATSISSSLHTSEAQVFVQETSQDDQDSVNLVGEEKSTCCCLIL